MHATAVKNVSDGLRRYAASGSINSPPTSITAESPGVGEGPAEPIASLIELRDRVFCLRVRNGFCAHPLLYRS